MFREAVEYPRSKRAWMIMMYPMGSCGAVVNPMSLDTRSCGVRVIRSVMRLASQRRRGRMEAFLCWGIYRRGERRLLFVDTVVMTMWTRLHWAYTPWPPIAASQFSS